MNTKPSVFTADKREAYLSVLFRGWDEFRLHYSQVPAVEGLDRERLEAFLIGYHEGVTQQNLSTAIQPEQFLRTHLLDVLALRASGFISSKDAFLDIGSGAGVPGLLFWSLFGGLWCLSDSETSKAAHLESETLRLGEIFQRGTPPKVYSGRAENYLGSLGQSVTPVVRAVGSLSQIFELIRDCSTWNNLIVLKGPRFEEEVKELERLFGLALTLTKEFRYKIDPNDPRERTIALFSRP